MTRLRQAPTWQAKSEWETKIIEHFRFFRVFRGQKGLFTHQTHLLFLLVSFRVFRGQKRFIYPPNTLKDAKISKTKIGWFMFPRQKALIFQSRIMAKVHEQTQLQRLAAR